MKLLTRHSDYALRALVYLARFPRRRLCAEELVEKLEIPDAFLRRLLQALGQAGILRSSRGKGGGFSLGRHPSEIRVSDVMRVFQGSLSMNDCMLRKRVCPNRGTCPLRSKLRSIEAKVLKDLEATTIASLMKEQ